MVFDDIRAVQFTGVAQPSVSTRTSSGTPLRWESGCVFLRLDATGTPDLPFDQVTGALALAIDGWEQATGACSYLQLETETPDDGEVGLDLVNRIIFREDTWSYDASAVAITTLFFVDRPGDPMDGIILDADIELNAVNVTFGTGSGAVYDLANTLAHELGHVVGLDHNCWSGIPPQPLEDDGDPVPPCFPLPPAEITEATMFPTEDPGETKKRTPEADDVDGWCGHYATAADPGTCEPVTMLPADPVDAGVPDAGSVTPPADEGGCCSSEEKPPSLLLAFAASALVFRRRSSARRPAPARCGSARRTR